ncbi:MAG TPA: DUF72 domain-containing protein [Capillimicrobium sp.]|jgi:uncharacterized protein YecE (DUF72 family)
MGSSGAGVRLGLCGFTIGAAEYFRRFRVVEVQQTFYHPPQDATLVRWRRQAPPGFEFTLKAWQLVTHDASSPTYRRLRRPLDAADRELVGSFRLTPPVLRAWGRTLECVRLLGATAILLQCPRSFRPTDENVARLTAFCREVSRPEGVRLVWEPRGPWPAELVGDLCRELDLVHAVDPFVSETVTPGRAYFRLHGVTGARHVYTDDELRRLLAMLPGQAQEAYVLFNNIPRVIDAERFRTLLRA